MNEFIKATKVVNTQLGLLLRDVVLPQLVWRDAVGDFRGAKDDTVSIKLPAFASARTRALRGGAARTKDNLHQRKVDVTLDTDIYKDVGITDEELSLDIESFGEEVLNPIMVGVGIQIEDELVSTVSGATYQNEIEYTSGQHEPYDDVAVAAREYLNKARVPQTGRFLALGASVESDFLKSDDFHEADKSGSTGALRNAQLPAPAGFDGVVSVPGLGPNEGYAFHRTAYVLSNRAPVVPSGAPWGASRKFRGFALRTVRVFDPDAVEDRLVTDSWVGSNVTKDVGSYDADGIFTPAEDPDASGEDELLVRAVKITRTESS